MEFLNQYKYPIAGAALGLLLAGFLVTLGFFRTLLLVAVVLVGAYVGTLFQGSGILEEFISKIKNSKTQK